jgi:hypothetical protein
MSYSLLLSIRVSPSESDAYFSFFSCSVDMNLNFYNEFPNLRISLWCSLFLPAGSNLYSFINVPFDADKSTINAFVNSGLISIIACLLETDMSFTWMLKFGFLPITVYFNTIPILFPDF